MTTALSLPPGYPRVRRVHSFAELVGTPLANGVNALCWERTVPGDFGAVVRALGPGEGLIPLDAARLHALELGADGGAAVATMLDDHRQLLALGLAPELNCIHGYPRDDEAGVVPVDVYSFHADRAPVPTDTYLCTYYGAPSEALRNEDARRHVDIPATRSALQRTYGGEDNAEFATYLAERCYDLHYAAVPGARPFSFGLGHLWRIAVEYPDNPVPPCVHRAPATGPGDPPRLLLIS
jgi:hypothetical protein